MSASVEQLGPRDAQALREFLARDAAHNLYLLGLFEEFGIVAGPGQTPFAFFGRFRSRELTAALFVGGEGGLMIPSANDNGESIKLVEALSGKFRFRAGFGEQPALDAMVRHFGEAGAQRTVRTQRLFRVSPDDLGPFTNPTLRLAGEEDLPQVLELAAGAVREIHGRDPLAEDAEGFEARVAQRLRAKRTYVLELEGRLVFKVDIGSRSQFGAELEGVYTVRDERRRRHAILSMGQISRFLLSSMPRLVLRIDEQDQSMADLARKVGYVAGRSQRVVVLG
jgi:uncharacterized protein